MPRLFALISGLVLALCWGGVSPARQADDAPISVIASTDVAGVVLRYRLPAPVTQFEFADRDIIRDLWTVTTPGLTLADGAVSGSAPFDAFEVRVRPDAAEVDRIYQGLSRIGDGHVIYGPGVKANDGDTVLTFDLAAGETSLPPADAIGGYAYLGAGTQVVADPRGDVAIGANVDTELAEPLRQTFFNSMAFYERRLGAGLPFRPALMVSVDSPGPTTFRGDVTGTGLISLRFKGDAWRDTGDQLTTFVWHETFHLWNGHAVVDRDGDTDPWLHEGGAEYAALLGAVSVGELTEEQGRAIQTRNLNRCRDVLGASEAASSRLRSGSGPYACGALIQWLADLEFRKQDGDVLALWKTMLASARGSPQGYGVAEFRAGLLPDSAVTVLLDGPGATRWQSINERLAALGVTLVNRPGDKDLQGAALFHLAKRNCKTGSYGFFDEPGALKLDGADCGVLSGDPSSTRSRASTHRPKAAPCSTRFRHAVQPVRRSGTPPAMAAFSKRSATRRWRHRRSGRWTTPHRLLWPIPRPERRSRLRDPAFPVSGEGGGSPMTRLLALAAATLALLFAGSAARAGAPAYAVTACPADWTAQSSRKVECGTLTVDETRGDPNTRRIDIAVAVVKASAPYKDTAGQTLPPVIVFHGGPGGDLVRGLGRRLAFYAANPERAGPLAAIDQDWIYFDQRGGGLGNPSMDCPGAQLTDAGPPSKEDADKLIACLKGYAAAGVNLSQYNAAVIAADVADLKAALHLDRIDLFGGSYGPRIEAAVITHAPQGVRAVVMDSPWPPEGNWAVHTPEQVSAAVKIILGKCAAQAECGARHPDLQTRFEANARKWLAGPQADKDGKTYTVEDLASFLMDTTYSGSGVRSLPADLEKIIAGDLTAVAEGASSRTYYTEGQHMTHLCKEELPFESKAALAAGAAGDPVAEVSVPSLSRLFDVCAAIDVGAADPVENAPVHTDIPTLFIAAEIDPGCPPPLTRKAAEGYTNSQVMIVTNATHGVTGQNPCAARAARDFLRDPSKPVDQSCLPAPGTPLVFAEE